VEQTPQIDKEMLDALITKYKGVFEAQFNQLQLNVYFTSNGQPPTPDDYRNTPETTEAAGLFVKVDKDYRIGINEKLSVELRLMAFFHEYGHAVYRCQANEPIDNKEALIRTETAALLKSLELADIEGLPQIARLAVQSACLFAMDPVYQAAVNNVKSNSLWLKYSYRS
jgi:hypothetical protein